MLISSFFFILKLKQKSINPIFTITNLSLRTLLAKLAGDSGETEE
jgi:hypothetical protein